MFHAARKNCDNGVLKMLMKINWNIYFVIMTPTMMTLLPEECTKITLECHIIAATY